MKILLASCLIFLLHLHVSAQTFRPDLHKADLWEIQNREVQTVTDGGKKVVQFNANEKEGFMILKDYNFTNGTIEFDVKGKNVLQQSFVGVTFHFQDMKTQDVVYFRPFNFMN